MNLKNRTVIQMTIPQILTSDFWDSLGSRFLTDNHPEISKFIIDNKNNLFVYSAMTYDGLSILTAIEKTSDEGRADIAYMIMGDAFTRIYKALTTDYDPLENFYTDRTLHDDISGSTEKLGTEERTRTGDQVTSPSGNVKVTSTGTRKLSVVDGSTVGQGTTFETATTDPKSTSDFRNISKTINDSEQNESFEDFGTNTGYENYEVKTKYNDVKDKLSFQSRSDSTTGSHDIDEHKKGNSGIFSKQDLTFREIKLRLREKITEILVRMIVDIFNSGVWE